MIEEPSSIILYIDTYGSKGQSLLFTVMFEQ
jgi:hypothetical protein